MYFYIIQTNKLKFNKMKNLEKITIEGTLFTYKTKKELESKLETHAENMASTSDYYEFMEFGIASPVIQNFYNIILNRMLRQITHIK